MKLINRCHFKHTHFNNHHFAFCFWFISMKIDFNLSTYILKLYSGQYPWLCSWWCYEEQLCFHLGFLPKHRTCLCFHFILCSNRIFMSFHFLFLARFYLFGSFFNIINVFILLFRKAHLYILLLRLQLNFPTIHFYLMINCLSLNNYYSFYYLYIFNLKSFQILFQVLC